MIDSFLNASFRDDMTGLYSEAYFMEIFYREWHRVIRENLGLSLLIVKPNINIVAPDGLKEYISLAHILDQSTMRMTDIVSRYNKTDFVIGLFDLNSQGTAIVVQRIMSAIQKANGQLNQLQKAFIGGYSVSPNSQIDINSLFEEVSALESSSQTIRQSSTTANISDRVSCQLCQYSH
ncbi:MAG: PleD family two-component response regulator [Alteromonadaceae bacterium]|jgi:PleD family two-component response regulator